MKWSTMKNAKVSLLQIGGKQQSIKVQKSAKQQLKLTPNKLLKPGTKYYVVLTSKTKNSKRAYTELAITK